MNVCFIKTEIFYHIPEVFIFAMNYPIVFRTQPGWGPIDILEEVFKVCQDIFVVRYIRH